MNLSKMMALLLAAALLLALAPAALAGTVQSGTLEGGGTWELDADGVLTIGGPASLLSDELDYDLRQMVHKVVYGPEVVEIAPGVFSYSYDLTAFEVDPANPNYTAVDGVLYNKAMTELIEAPTAFAGSLVVPEGVKTLRYNAFIGTGLTGITLPESLETIEEQCFWNSELAEITLPAGLTNIEDSAFTRVQSLTAFTVADGNKAFAAVDGVLFSGDGTVLLKYPNARQGESYTVSGVESVGSSAFRSNEGLTSVTLAEGVRELGINAFAYSELAEIHLPASLSSIEFGAFAECRNLTNVYYAGTTAQWAQVSIGGNNSSLQFCSIHCADGDAVPAPIEGSCGEGVAYTLTPAGQLTVSGAGEWDGYAFSNNDNVITAVLEPGVTEIGWGGFDWCQSLEEISIPDTVTEIKSFAFYYCESLRSISIPASVAAFGEEVFEGCDRLREIQFGGTVEAWQAMVDMDANAGLRICTVYCADGTIERTEEPPEEEFENDYTYRVEGGTLYIDGEAFSWIDFYDDEEALAATTAVMGPDLQFISRHITELYNLEEIVVDPQNAHYASADGVLYDKELTLLIGCPRGKTGTVNVPEGVKALGTDAFMDTRLTRVILPESVETIKAQCFWSSEIAEIRLPAGLKNIDPTAFTYCRNLAAFEVAPGNDAFTTVDGVLFSGDMSVLVKYPDGRSDAAYTAPAVESIGAWAFFGNDRLISLTLPEGVENIFNVAFYESALTEIRLPATLRAIEEGAFARCYRLTGVSYAGTTEQWEAVTIEGGNEELRLCTIHCADGDVASQPIQGACGDTVAYTLMPDGLLVISGAGEWDEWFFPNNARIRRVVLEPGVTEIGEGAFFGLHNLESISICDTVERIKNDALYECVKLRSVAIPASVTYIGGNAFSNMWGLTDIYYAGTEAQWAAIQIEEGNDSLFAATLHFESDGPTVTKSLVLPPALREIEDEAFAGIDAEEVYIYQGCTTIGAGAFRNCPNLVIAYIPVSVTEIGEGAFAQCPNLKIRTPSSFVAVYAEENGIPFELMGE